MSVTPVSLKHQRAFCVLAATIIALLAAVCTPLQALAAWDDIQTAPVGYVERGWDGSQVTEATKECTSYTLLVDRTESNAPQGGANKFSLFDGGIFPDHKPVNWFVADRDQTFDERCLVQGDAHLIIKDGVTITCRDGIQLPSGSSLTIYSQAAGSSKLEALADTNQVAAIGGNDDQAGGNITIHGGTVIANAYNSNEGEDGAGIGGGDDSAGGTFTIYGGTVEAQGANYGSGIGGGQNGAGGTVNIYGGSVTARGGMDAAGIGGGESASGGTVNIYGGVVEAHGDHPYGPGISANTHGAGIGGGEDGDGGVVNISGGEVNAWGGVDAAGIGGGDAGNGATTTISGGKVVAHGGGDAAGIGGGDGANGTTITITNGIVEAYGGSYGAGIGGGDGDGTGGSGGTITIEGGTVSAYGGTDAAGIGGGEDGSAGVITISGGNVTAKGGSESREGGAGIGSGEVDGEHKGVPSAGEITISDGVVDAQGGPEAAGIGGGSGVPGEKITITGGTVTAKGGHHAAGIGGGHEGASGTIVIKDGTVEATGGRAAAGIGTGALVGKLPNTVNITINGGTVTARAGEVPDDYDALPPAAIGTGGGAVDFVFGTKIPSYFSGAINLNGGYIEAFAASVDSSHSDADAYAVIGTGDMDNLAGVTGEVNFNGAHVLIHNNVSGDYGLARSVRASNITILEDESTHIHQLVRYKESSSDWTNALWDKRVDELKAKTYTDTEVLPCPHEDVEYSDTGSSDKHKVACKYCTHSEEEDHTYGQPEWTWANDYSWAKAKFVCGVCNHIEELTDSQIDSETSGKKIDEQGKAYNETTYTAKVTLCGKEYTDSKLVRNDLDPAVVQTPPEPKKLTYRASELELVTAGTATGGTMQYALGTSSETAPTEGWSDSLPKGINAGTYHVWYKVAGDETHADSAPACVDATIAKAALAAPVVLPKSYNGAKQIADLPASNRYTVTANEGGTDVGVYDVELTLSDPSNYKWMSTDGVTNTVKFRITQAKQNTVTVSIEGWTSGETPKAPTATATFGSPTFTYATKGSTDYSDTVPTDPGVYTVRASVAETANYVGGEATADFTINPVVTFDANGGAGTKDAEAVEYGASYTLPAADTFSAQGEMCRFASWEVAIGSDAPVTKAPGDSIKVTANTTVKAMWEGHKWGTPTYTWTANNSAVTATHTCVNDASHTESELGEVTSAITKEPTEFEGGIRTYTATFKNPAFATQTKTETIPKLPRTPVYRCTQGDGSSWTKGSKDGLPFVFKRNFEDNTTFGHFTGITVDGKVVDPSNYTSASGSAVVTLKPTYLETLSTGKHTLTAFFDDGNDPSATFAIKEASSRKATPAQRTPSLPKTGDPASGALAAPALLAAAGFLAAGIAARRREHNAK